MTRHHPANDVGRVNPIDSELLAAAWLNSDAKRALLEEITTIPVNSPIPVHPDLEMRTPRRTFRLSVASAAALAVLVLAQVLFVDTTPAFAVRELPNGLIEINVLPQFRDGPALATELRAYGIDVEITTMVASPSAVGQVDMSRQVLGEDFYVPEGITFGEEGTPDVFNWTIDPKLFTERLIIRMHVAARPGEQYVLAEEVFEPGEALGGLHCALGEPLRAQDLVPYLADLGITPIWFVVSPTDDPSIFQSEQVQEAPNARVLDGHSLDADTIRFNLALDGVTSWQTRLSDVPCTPEQAAGWR